MTPTKKQSFVRDDIFSDTQGGVGAVGLTFIQADVVGVVESEESKYFGVSSMNHVDDDETTLYARKRTHISTPQRTRNSPYHQ